MKIVVIGGGVMGLSCAWRLAKAGPAVTVLEARTCGGGATLASLGALWPPSPLVAGPLQQLHRESLWGFEQFAQQLARDSNRPISFRRLGRLELLSDKEVPRAREEAAVACEHWPAYSEAPVMQVLTPAQINEQWPTIAGGQHGVVCRATGQVLVPELIAALRHACTRAGVSIREQAPVTGLHQNSADAVLVTTGAWTSQLAPEIATAAPVRPVKGQGIALSMPPGFPNTILKSGKIYLVPWRETGEILVGSTTEPEAGFDESPTDAGLQTLLEGAAAIVPALRNAKPLRHWAGLRPQNPAKRHLPIMGPHPAIPNLFICTAHYKTGIGLAPIVSTLMTRAILEPALPPQLTPFLPYTK